MSRYKWSHRFFSQSIVWALFASVLLCGSLALAQSEDDKGNSKEQLKEKAKAAMKKAQEEAKKIQDDVKKAEPKNLEDAKKLAKDKFAVGKDALSKRLAKSKDGTAAPEAKKEKDSASDKTSAKEQKSSQGKKLAKGQAEKIVDSVNDTDTVPSEEAEQQRLMQIKRREIGYIAHRKHLAGDKKHQDMIASAAAKTDDKSKEQRKHLKRTAKIKRMQELAADEGNTQLLTRISALQKKEIARHEQEMKKIVEKGK